MNAPRSRLLAAAFLASLAMPLQAAVNVTYGEPDRFTDAGDQNTDPRKVMKVLADQLKQLGDKYLPAGANLDIEVLDLDRAGRPRMNLPTEVRVVSGKGDMPCIDVRYTFTVPGRQAKSAREHVCDPEFLRQLEPRYDEHDPLVYEKRMIDEWFKQRFGGGKAPD